MLVGMVEATVESARTKVWKRLGSSASEKTPVRIILFDTGTDKAFNALVTKVIPPLEESAQQTHPKVSAAEHKLVPSYYRTSPFSRAWMRLIEIDEKPIPFFKQFSFATVPPLPNYSQNVLDSLRNKVILDGDELRGMDTTIWEVRPKQQGDKEDKILFTIPALPSPIEAQPVYAESDAILHITDLHFAVDSRAQHVWRLESETATRRSLAEAIEGAIGERKIGLIVVTGDLTFNGSEKDFREARVSLLRLLGIFNLGPDHLVVAPGNHDIRWASDEVYDHKAEVTQAPEEAKRHFRVFYRSLFGHDANDHLSMGRRFLLPSGVSVDICAVNSSSLLQGKHFLAGMGRVQEAAVGCATNL